MCSSRPSESLRAGARRSWSLRARLLAGQVALLTVACLGIGAVTELALYQYLVSQLDHQLSDAARRSARLHGQPPA
ncbi:MAG: two-component sensor histidine kinase, partial [Mycolicibacter algericus]